MTPCARPAPAPGEMKKTCPAQTERALPAFPDVGYARGPQLRFINGRQVQMDRAFNPAHVRIPGPETARHLGTDLVAADADRRSDRRAQILRTRSPSGGQGAHRGGGYIFGRSAPACVNCRNCRYRRINQQDRHAVGRFHSHEDSGPVRDQRVAFLSYLRPGVHHKIGVDLLHRPDLAGQRRIAQAEAVNQPFRIRKVGCLNHINLNHARAIAVGLL